MSPGANSTTTAILYRKLLKGGNMVLLGKQYLLDQIFSFQMPTGGEVN